MESWKIFGVTFGIIVLLFAVLLLLPSANKIPEIPGYLEINNETMICDYFYLCFLREGEWHRPEYNAGTNLILANNLESKNDAQMKKFFEQEKINIVVNTTEKGSLENAELILRVAPFSHYLGYYYSTVKKEKKIIESFVLSQYNLTESAIIIFGPNLGAKENSIKFDGMNIVVQGESSEQLSILLGKLLLIAVS